MLTLTIMLWVVLAALGGLFLFAFGSMAWEAFEDWRLDRFLTEFENGYEAWREDEFERTMQVGEYKPVEVAGEALAYGFAEGIDLVKAESDQREIEDAKAEAAADDYWQAQVEEQRAKAHEARVLHVNLEPLEGLVAAEAVDVHALTIEALLPKAVEALRDAWAKSIVEKL